ncbi:hypothetical protein ACFPPD_02150 [Cohnella suwonensis]|uniref:Uncharacterized protein n=1 Tax=Cohnella suwonensis TaxID=696072 RepID=A0ABW0LRB1_9BACL
MTANRIDNHANDVDGAKARLRDWLQPRLKPEAMQYMQKLMNL